MYKMERLTFRLRLQEETFKKHWGKWTIYVSKQKEDINAKVEYVH